ncbi:hypothetical protein EJB05_53830, partial [Eragrostis curvula]
MPTSRCARSTHHRRRGERQITAAAFPCHAHSSARSPATRKARHLPGRCPRLEARAQFAIATPAMRARSAAKSAKEHWCFR